MQTALYCKPTMSSQTHKHYSPWKTASTYICSIPPNFLWASSLATNYGLWKAWPPWLWGHQASWKINWHYSLALCQDMQKPSQNEQGKLQDTRKLLPRSWRRTWTKPFGICMLWDLHGSLDTDFHLCHFLQSLVLAEKVILIQRWTTTWLTQRSLSAQAGWDWVSNCSKGLPSSMTRDLQSSPSPLRGLCIPPTLTPQWVIVSAFPWASRQHFNNHGVFRFP